MDLPEMYRKPTFIYYANLFFMYVAHRLIRSRQPARTKTKQKFKVIHTLTYTSLAISCEARLTCAQK